MPEPGLVLVAWGKGRAAGACAQWSELQRRSCAWSCRSGASEVKEGLTTFLSLVVGRSMPRWRWERRRRDEGQGRRREGGRKKKEERREKRKKKKKRRKISRVRSGFSIPDFNSSSFLYKSNPRFSTFNSTIIKIVSNP